MGIYGNVAYGKYGVLMLYNSPGMSQFCYEEYLKEIVGRDREENFI